MATESVYGRMLLIGSDDLAHYFAHQVVIVCLIE